MKRVLVLMLCLAALCSWACQNASSVASQGDPEKGRQAFVALQCHTCHEVSGGDLPAPTIVPAVQLGGRRLLPPSRERITEDILLPSSHFAQGYPVGQIAANDRSRMPEYAKQLSEAQVKDIVAFLKSRYSMGIPSPTR